MLLHTYTLSPYHWIFMLLGGVALVILLVVNLLIANYMHKDAIKRGIKNSEFWLLIGFFLGLLGLLLYVFVRKNYEERT
jgi:Trk-type K+ transport system membrane component